MIDVLWQIAGLAFSAIAALSLLFLLFVVACAVGKAIWAMMSE